MGICFLLFSVKSYDSFPLRIEGSKAQIHHAKQLIQEAQVGLATRKNCLVVDG
jgi:hypothetical protein